MNLQDLANLVLLRNHVSYLLNSERTIVTKDLIRQTESLKSDMDRLILDEAFDLDLEGLQNGGVPYVIMEAPNEKVMQEKKQAAKNLVASVQENGDVTMKGKVVVENNAVTVAPPDDAEEKQLSFDFENKQSGKAKIKRKTSKAKAQEEKEISDRVEQAKKEVAARKATGSFKRTGNTEE